MALGFRTGQIIPVLIDIIFFQVNPEMLFCCSRVRVRLLVHL